MVPKLINMSEGSAVEFRFYEALRETTISLKNRLVQEIGGKITMIFHKLTVLLFFSFQGFILVSVAHQRRITISFVFVHPILFFQKKISLRLRRSKRLLV